MKILWYDIKKEGDILTNEEKLEFIKTYYKFTRMWELRPKEEKDSFYKEWIKTFSHSIPTYLYKYRECNENNLSALKNKKAWFSNPTSWNDCLDVTVHCDLKKDLAIFKESYDKYVPKIAYQILNSNKELSCEQKKFVTLNKLEEVYSSAFKGDKKFNLTRMVECLTPIVGDESAHQFAVKIQETIAKDRDLISNISEDVIKKFLSFNDIKSKYIMYSLSETYSNNHQWAIYANNGKGFCIGYKIVSKNIKENCLIPTLLPIYYGERKELSLAKIIDEWTEYFISAKSSMDFVNQMGELIFVSFYTKTFDWNGEQEWRLCVSSENTKTNLIDFDFVQSIYLGENIEDEWKYKLIEIAKEQNLSVFQRKLDKTKSHWIYEKIKL